MGTYEKLEILIAAFRFEMRQMNLLYGGWIDRWMRWMDGWIGWMDGQMDGLDKWMDEMNGWIGWTDGWI